MLPSMGEPRLRSCRPRGPNALTPVNDYQLSRLVDAHTVELLQAVNGFSVEKALLGVKNLEDAYQLVNDLENGETNAIFQFLLDNFETDVQIRDFLRAQLNQHISRLSIDLPVQYKGILARKAIQASE